MRADLPSHPGITFICPRRSTCDQRARYPHPPPPTYLCAHPPSLSRSTAPTNTTNRGFSSSWSISLPTIFRHSDSTRSGASHRYSQPFRAGRAAHISDPSHPDRPSFAHRIALHLVHHRRHSLSASTDRLRSSLVPTPTMTSACASDVFHYAPHPASRTAHTHLLLRLASLDITTTRTTAISAAGCRCTAHAPPRTARRAPHHHHHRFISFSLTLHRLPPPPLPRRDHIPPRARASIDCIEAMVAARVPPPPDDCSDRLHRPTARVQRQRRSNSTRRQIDERHIHDIY